MRVKIKIINNVYGSNDKLLLKKGKIYNAHYNAKEVMYAEKNDANMYILSVEKYRILKTPFFTRLGSAFRYFRSLP
jgi:hypothetical protein